MTIRLQITQHFEVDGFEGELSAEIRLTRKNVVRDVIDTTGEPVPPPSLPPAPAAPRPLRHLQIVREAA